MLITTCQSLVGPLKKAEAERSNTDNQMIETVLHVIRYKERYILRLLNCFYSTHICLYSNLLAIDAIPSCCSRNEIYRAMESHNELIKMFQVFSDIRLCCSMWCNCVALLIGTVGHDY